MKNRFVNYFFRLLSPLRSGVVLLPLHRFYKATPTTHPPYGVIDRISALFHALGWSPPSQFPTRHASWETSLIREMEFTQNGFDLSSHLSFQINVFVVNIHTTLDSAIFYSGFIELCEADNYIPDNLWFIFEFLFCEVRSYIIKLEIKWNLNHSSLEKREKGFDLICVFRMITVLAYFLLYYSSNSTSLPIDSEIMNYCWSVINPLLIVNTIILCTELIII